MINSERVHLMSVQLRELLVRRRAPAHHGACSSHQQRWVHGSSWPFKEPRRCHFKTLRYMGDTRANLDLSR